jgi:hypothetical protein
MLFADRIKHIWDEVAWQGYRGVHPPRIKGMKKVPPLKVQILTTSLQSQFCNSATKLHDSGSNFTTHKHATLSLCKSIRDDTTEMLD